MNVKLHRTLNKFLLFDIMENQEIKQTLKEINREFL